MYKLLYELNEENKYKSPWLNCVKTILEDCGFPGFGEVKSSLVVRNASNNKLNQAYLIRLDKNGHRNPSK